jgi:hypothetical protein
VNRAAFPIQDLHTFVHMVRRQLQEIVDPLSKYYALPFVSLREHVDDGFHMNLEVQDDGTITRLFAGIIAPDASFTANPVGAPSGGPLVKIDLIGPPFIFAGLLEVIGAVEHSAGTIDFAATSDLIFASGATATFETGCVVDFDSGSTLDMNPGSTLDAAGALVTVNPNDVDFSVNKNIFLAFGAGPVFAYATEGNANMVTTGTLHYVQVVAALTSDTFWIPIIFQDGTELDQVEISGNRQVAGSTVDLTVYRQNLATGVFTAMGTASFAAGIADRTATVSTIGHTMDTTTRAYYAHVVMTNGATGTGDIRIYSARFRGILNALYPT